MKPLLLSYEMAVVRNIDTNEYSILLGIADQAEKQRAIVLPLIFEASNGWKVRSSMQSDISISKKTVHILGADHSGDAVDRITKVDFPTQAQAQEAYEAITMALAEWEVRGGFDRHSYDEKDYIVQISNRIEA